MRGRSAPWLALLNPRAPQDALSKTIPIWAATINSALFQLRQAANGPGAGSSSVAPSGQEVQQHGSIGRDPSSPVCSRTAEHDDAGCDPWDVELHSPLFISGSEHAGMSDRLPAFTAQLLEAMHGSLPEDVLRLAKPLRPLWIAQTSHIVTNRIAQPEELPFTPIILISASLPALYLRKEVRLPLHGEADAAQCSGTYMCAPTCKCMVHVPLHAGPLALPQ